MKEVPLMGASAVASEFLESLSSWKWQTDLPSVSQQVFALYYLIKLFSIHEI